MAKIALNARLLIPDQLEGIGGYTHEICSRWIAAHPEDEFLLLFDRTPAQEFDYGSNAKCLQLLPPARRPWLIDLWFDWAVSRALRRWGADVFVSMEGYLSRRSDVPQVNVIHDINFEHHPEWVPPRIARHNQARFPEYAALARKVVTVSEHSRQDLCQTYGLSPDKVEVIGNAAGPGFAPMGSADQSRWRAERMQGERYWLFVGSLHPRKNIAGLLAAYRAYRQAGGQAKLAIVGAHLFRRETMSNQPPGVLWLGRVSRGDLPSWVGAAEGLIYLPHFEGFGVPLVEAMASGVPIVASDVTSIPEVLAGAAFALVSPMDASGAGRAMRSCESDVASRQLAVDRGLIRALEFDWEQHARNMRQVVYAAINSEKPQL
ncbi:MAG: glycosyltransferase family 4 protein [Flavobacteriales bacterium]